MTTAADLATTGIRDAASAVSLGVSQAGDRQVWSFGADGPTPDSVYRLASLTKPFTAAATVLAARSAGMPLTTPVLDVLPALRSDWRADPAVSVVDVLGQVSGLRSTVSAADVANLGSGDGALLEAARLVGHAGSERAPGQVWEYYNGNYFLAGAILAELTRTTYEQALTRLILEPWGLVCTGFTPPDDLGPVLRILCGARSIRQALVPGVEDGRRVVARPFPRGRRPSGGLCSSVSDLLTFGELLISDDALIREVAHCRTAPGDAMAYGLGWALGPSGQLYLNGRLPGYRTVLLLLPDDGLAIAALANDSAALPALASAGSLLQQPFTGDDVARTVERFAA